MRRWIALLLAPAAAVSAFVALVVDPTTGLVAGAAAVLTIGAVAVAGTVWRLAGEEEAAPAPGATAARRSSALLVSAAVVVAVGAVVAVAAVLVAGRDESQASPQRTVRDFLIAAVVENDGRAADTYLTPHGRREAVRLGGEDDGSREALDGVALVGPSGAVTTERQVEQLKLGAHVNGSHATVDVPTAQGMRRVRLTDEGARGTDEFDPPPTPWRINGRLTAVLR